MSGSVITIGRSSSATLVADDPTVSRIHAEASLVKSGKAEVRDRESKNGLFVVQDGARERVSKAVIGKGDTVILGAYELSGARIIECLSATTVIEKRLPPQETPAVAVSFRGCGR